MAKSIKLTSKEWATLRKRLKEEFNWKPSVFMIRTTMRRELGFTTRRHRYYDIDNYCWTEEICLDFFDDAKETWFRLKYL